MSKCIFITIKKKVLLIILIFAVALSLLIIGLSHHSTKAMNNNLGKTIVLDAGHGGIDGGVVGNTTQVRESEINLAICKNLKKLLEEKGYNVVMTRTNNDGLYDSNDKNKKQADMRKRKQIINSVKADLVISIHQNFYPLQSVKGAQVFYDKNSEISQEYAKKTQDIMNKQLECDRFAKTGDYFILQCSSFPSLLIECGFLSNPIEEQQLITPKYQEKVAYSIFSSINSILLSNDDMKTFIKI